MAISISGSGQIAGVSRVAGSLDAASKAYVDARVGAARPGFDATGGTERFVDIGGVMFKVHVFTSSAQLVVSNAVGDIEYLVVGGGGGGAAELGGGGGAGGFASGRISLAAGTHDVVIGAGGAGEQAPSLGGAAAGAEGGVSSLAARVSAAGGSGGLATGVGGAQGGATVDGVTVVGNAGGGVVSALAGNGGGGAAGAGVSASSVAGGAGGAGVDVGTFLGEPVWVAAEGGAGGRSWEAPQYDQAAAPAAAAASTGSGGSGGGLAAGSPTLRFDGAAGAAGVVAIRYPVVGQILTEAVQHPLAGEPALTLSDDGAAFYQGSELATAADIAAAVDSVSPRYFVEHVVAGDYTLTLSDVARIVAFDSASAATLTVPSDASVAFPVGTVINVYRAGTGAVTIAGAAGVTVRNAGTVPAQFGERSLRKRDTDEWVLA
jgi:hypothetical protein